MTSTLLSAAVKRQRAKAFLWATARLDLRDTIPSLAVLVFVFRC